MDWLAERPQAASGPACLGHLCLRMATGATPAMYNGPLVRATNGLFCGAFPHVGLFVHVPNRLGTRLAQFSVGPRLVW